MKKLMILAALITAVSCTKKQEAPAPAAPAAAEAGKAAGTTIVISTVGESMAYDQKELNVKAGEQVTLTLKNGSASLKHNWLLVQAGKDNEVGIEGIKAGEAKGYIPDHPAIIAKTKLVDSKGEDTITFTAPAAGDYPYLCTFPGHHTIMKGVLHSK